MHRVGRRLERLEDFRFEGRLHECIEFNVCHAADAAQASFFCPTPPRKKRPPGPGRDTLHYKYLLSSFVLYKLHFHPLLTGFTGIKSSYISKACPTLARKQ